MKKEIRVSELKRLLAGWAKDSCHIALKTIVDKPSKLSHANVAHLNKAVYEKFPLSMFLSYNSKSFLTDNNELITGNNKLKDEEVDCLHSLYVMLCLEFGWEAVSNIADFSQDMPAEIKTKISKNRLLIVLYIVVVFKDAIFTEIDKAVIEYLKLGEAL